MPRAFHLPKEMILAAMTQTKSVHSAARYLNCSYQHIKKYMLAYTDESTGKSLFEIHKNQSGKGIPKHLASPHPNATVLPHILKIINGEVSASHFHPDKIKASMIESGYMKEECYACGFAQRRTIDHKPPLLLNFIDGNKVHWGLNNVQLLCYNCYFLYVGNVFTKSDVQLIESGKQGQFHSDYVNFELDEYHLNKLDELGGWDDSVDDDPYSLVSRRK
jgi:hypothetical protein